MTDDARFESGDQHAIDRDAAARAIAEKANQAADRWWHDRKVWLDALENDPFWEEPRHWLNESRPPVQALGEVLGHVLTSYEPGESIDVIELLEWIHHRSTWAYEDGHRYAERGFGKASSAVRETSGFGWPDPDPILGEVSV